MQVRESSCRFAIVASLDILSTILQKNKKNVITAGSVFFLQRLVPYLSIINIRLTQ